MPHIPRPEPVNWLPAPPEPVPADRPFLGLAGGPAPEPATEYSPRPNDYRTLSDLLPFPIPDGPLPSDDDLIPGVADLSPLFDVARLKSVLQDLIACRQLLDAALKDG